MGLEVILAVRATVLVKPFAGETVMVEVLPVVAPAFTVTAEPVIVKLGVGTAVMMREAVPVAGG